MQFREEVSREIFWDTIHTLQIAVGKWSFSLLKDFSVKVKIQVALMEGKSRPR